MKLLPLAASALLVLLPVASGDEGDVEPTEAQIKREDAHRTVLRRFSVTGEAETKKLRLSKDATGFVDLFLDLQRNYDEKLAGRQPKSRIFPLPPTASYAMKDDGLYLVIASGSFVIDEARLPRADVVEVFRRALDVERFAHARVATDDREHFAAHRRSLMMLLLRKAEDVLERSSSWGRLMVTAGRDFLRGADEDPKAAGIYLGLLDRVGGEDLAPELLGRIAKAEDENNETALRIYRSALCSLPGPVARDYVETLVQGDDEDARLRALFHVREELSKETLELLSTWAAGLDLDPEGDRRYAALTALERMDTKASWKAMEAALEEAEDDQVRFQIAMTLARTGNTKGKKALAKIGREMERREDLASRRWAEIIRKLLEESR